MSSRFRLSFLEILCGVLMLLGVIVAFFYHEWGGLFVGFSFGLYFFEELQAYFVRAKESYTIEGLVRTLLLLGVILYLLLVATFFLIATVVAAVVRAIFHARNHE